MRREPRAHQAEPVGSAVSVIDWRGLARYVVTHPAQLPVLVRAGWRLRARHWWRHAPFLPTPDPAYWRFRVTTATGSPNGPISVDELVRVAQWSRHQRAGR